MNLPFAAGEFDSVVCQFGLMFVPDKLQALREARRVLRTDGQLLFSVWDEIERNDFAWRAHTTIMSFFPVDPPLFYEVPFCLHDQKQPRQWLDEAGFREIEAEQVQLDSVATSAGSAAQGLIFGNPVAGENIVLISHGESMANAGAAVPLPCPEISVSLKLGNSLGPL